MLDAIELREAAEERRGELLVWLGLLIAPTFLVFLGNLLVTARNTRLPFSNLWAGALVCWSAAGIWRFGFVRANWSGHSKPDGP